jgi:hypothetical protein
MRSLALLTRYILDLAQGMVVSVRSFRVNTDV